MILYADLWRCGGGTRRSSTGPFVFQSIWGKHGLGYIAYAAFLDSLISCYEIVGQRNGRRGVRGADA